jgi:hypothetical protein
LADVQGQPVVSLWLDQPLWNTPEEVACVRAVFDVFAHMPLALDVWLGSEGHLRASVARYKELGFIPTLDDRVLFIRKLENPKRRRRVSR